MEHENNLSLPRGDPVQRVGSSRGKDTVSIIHGDNHYSTQAKKSKHVDSSPAWSNEPRKSNHGSKHKPRKSNHGSKHNADGVSSYNMTKTKTSPNDHGSRKLKSSATKPKKSNKGMKGIGVGNKERGKGLDVVRTPKGHDAQRNTEQIVKLPAASKSPKRYAKQRVRSPGKSSVSPSVKSPVTSPVTSSVTAPCYTALKSQKRHARSPVKFPVTSPVTSSAMSPVTSINELSSVDRQNKKTE